MIFPGYASLIVDSFSMKLSDCMALGYFDIFIPFLKKKNLLIIFEETTYVTC